MWPCKKRQGSKMPLLRYLILHLLINFEEDLECGAKTSNADLVCLGEGRWLRMLYLCPTSLYMIRTISSSTFTSLIQASTVSEVLQAPRSRGEGSMCDLSC